MLEKLGLKCPVDEIKTVGDVWKLYDFIKVNCPPSEEHPLFHVWKTMFEDAKTLLAQRKQWERMLEGLIESCKAFEFIHANKDVEYLSGVIEQCTGMTWDEVREKI